MTCDPTMVPAPREVDIPSLKNRYREERDRRLRSDGQRQYAPAFQNGEALDYSDPHMARKSRAAIGEDVDVVMLGGGWAGFLRATTCGRSVSRTSESSSRQAISVACGIGIDILACHATTIRTATFRCWRKCSSSL